MKWANTGKSTFIMQLTSRWNQKGLTLHRSRQTTVRLKRALHLLSILETTRPILSKLTTLQERKPEPSNSRQTSLRKAKAGHFAQSGVLPIASLKTYVSIRCHGDWRLNLLPCAIFPFPSSQYCNHHTQNTLPKDNGHVTYSAGIARWVMGLREPPCTGFVHLD